MHFALFASMFNPASSRPQGVVRRIHFTMDTDRRIQDAIRAGEKNNEVAELIRNWCRHARVEKFRGVAMVEAQTGLPIGHHAMACDYAAARGMAMWDLGDAALDFHDRNCVGCPHRAPVALPNLSKLVGERENARAHEAARRQAHQEALAAQLAVRRQLRAELRTRLPPLAASIVDFVDELDGPEPKDAAAKLLGTAQLAPDTFDPRVIEYFFGLIEQLERWFYDVGLEVLRQLHVDPSRVTRCAMLALGDSRSHDIAAKIVESHAVLVDETQIAGALPALIERAHPRRYPMQSQIISVPGPLIALYKAHPGAVERTLCNLLDRHEPYLVSVGARGIEFLAQVDSGLPARFIRSLIAKLVRSKFLMQPERPSAFRDDGVLNDLQQALALAFQSNPDETDALAMQFVTGAAGEDEVQIYKVYEVVLRGRRRRDDDVPPDAADRTALRRLLTVATQTTSYDVLQEIQGTFTYVAEELVPLVRKELSTVLGAALMLSDKIDAKEQAAIVKDNPVSQLERSNLRDQRINLQRALVDWAAAAASDHPSATTQYLEVLAKVRDEHEMLRAELVKQSHRLMRSPEGLNAVLPTLYSALFGPVVRVRAAAAAAIGKLDGKSRDDMPALVYEALVAQLADPYVLVHQTAFETLEHAELPDALDREAQAAVVALINVYHRSRQDDRFLLNCICLYMDRYATEPEKAGRLGDVLIHIVDEMKPDVVSDELRRLRRHFVQKTLFANIVLRVLEEARAMNYREDDMLATLNALPAQEIFRHRVRLEALGSRPNVSPSLPRKLIETLTRVGAWAEAARVAEALYAGIPSTVEMHVRRLVANRYQIATQYEAAIASGQVDLLPGLSQDWRITETEIEKDRAAHERRRRPFPNIPGTH